MIKRFKKYIESKLIKFKLKFKTNNFLMIKAKYNAIDPHYMDDSTPKSLIGFLDTLSPSR